MIAMIAFRLFAGSLLDRCWLAATMGVGIRSRYEPSYKQDYNRLTLLINLVISRNSSLSRKSSYKPITHVELP